MRAGDWSRLAGVPADPAQPDPPLREEAADLQSRSECWCHLDLEWQEAC